LINYVFINGTFYAISLHAAFVDVLLNGFGTWCKTAYEYAVVSWFRCSAWKDETL